MSTITDTLRDIGINNGFMVCGEAADEIEALEKSYELLFTENAKLRAEQAEHRPSYAEAFDAIERGAAILTRACDDALDRLAALPQPAIVPSAVRKAVIDFLCAVDEQHDTKGLPLKYTVPWGALNALREAIGATPLQPNGDKP